jgi:uncharacterized protein YjdB
VRIFVGLRTKNPPYYSYVLFFFVYLQHRTEVLLITKYMKKIPSSVFIIIISLIAAFSFTACSGGGEDEIAVLSLRLDKTTLSLSKGETSRLTAIVSPSDATNPTVSWSSSDPAVATIDATGNVTALAAGSATVTARSIADGKFAATCSVTVTVAVESISIDKQEVTLILGQALHLNAIIVPSDATTKDVIWSSSDRKIVTVEDGNILAVGVGSATITATSRDGNKTAICSVKVENSENIIYNPYGNGQHW